MFYRLLLSTFLLFSFSVSAQEKTLLILGDSISAAYGIPVEQGWVTLLEQRLVRQGYAYKVVNASISGETTLGAKTRVNALIEGYKPALVIIELGGNDGLRGYSLEEIELNLLGIVKQIKQNNSDILLVPMQLPPNYGAAYNERFASIYKNVSDKMNVTMSQFILQDIAIHPELMQLDGIHPLQTAQVMMLDNVWQDLQKLLNK
jgi:acyl-CoA thioesterase I